MQEMMIDVREYPEYASGYIEGATLVPLGTLADACETWNREQPVKLVCKSGQRSERARQLLAGRGFHAVSVLPGGVDAWRAAGKPLIVVQRALWSLERQVRIAAGAMVFTSVTLGYFVSKYYLLLAAFVGAGLVFAGISNTCMMGTLLAKLPWNQSNSSGSGCVR